jgi:glycerate-2-kinase
VLVAGTDALVDQAVAAAARAGLAATVFLRGVTGDVTHVARRVAAQVRRIEAARVSQPCVFVAGGEPTIVMPERGPHSGPGASVGGRAQHLALLLARELAGVQGITVLVAGSDGIDGNSPAAGAVIDGDTWTALEQAGLDPERALARRDSHSALAAVDAALVTGPTGINHADLILIAAGA